jgi:hypothetical protein
MKDKNSTRSKGFAFVTLEDKGNKIYEVLDGSARKRILSKKHMINDKYVDVKVAEADKKKMDQLNANKKIFVGGLEPTVDASKSLH